ncbi:MAG: K(+)-insensitive pyrophosphate-energized proton pump [candidate division Zixibacteria bacterium RBG-1]|nr:MAG: K(+)-insensitive pyrophosphate-energized proton pump [candidate division Zixibacteria bacterium RBG-1]
MSFKKVKLLFLLVSLSLLFVSTSNIWAGEADAFLPPFDNTVNTLLYFVLLAAVCGLVYGIYLAFKVLKVDPGTPKMVEVSRAIQEGAKAYLTQQMRVLAIFIFALTVLIFFVYKNIYILPEGGGTNWKLVWGIALAFLLGSCLSAATGLIGMSVAVRANTRVANAARFSFKKALETAFEAGTVTGMFTVGMGLLGATIIFMIFKEQSMMVLLGFGFGGSLVALFMRVGGGIYTKAADVGADLVGKVEAGIPEDDPRNPATIADNVGDNVGDCAGMAADLFESYEVTLVAAMILGAAYAAFDPTPAGRDLALKMIVFPLLVRGVGVFASILGTWSVKGKDKEDFNPMRPIQNGFLVAALVSTIGFVLINYFYIKTPEGNPDWRFSLATFAGIVLAVIISYLTEYYTALEYSPVKQTAKASKTGPATVILAGFSEGLESTVAAILVIAVAVFASFIIFGGNLALAAYGIALCGMGMLTTTGFVVSMDSYGPISDNANGIFEMSKVLEEDKNPNSYKIVHKLDAVGNTTKAVTKGFAIASAVVAAVALFRSYSSEINILDPGLNFAEKGIQVNLPAVFVGLLIGGAMPFLFSSIAIRAVGRAAFQVVEEVRRQFREMPGIMEGKTKPDYSRCVAISTSAAQRELTTPGLIAVLTPMIVGFLLGVEGLGGFLAGIILTGQLLAVMFSNSGGTWDNAKKSIEAGLYGGKGTEAHKAGIIGDTVGDPFKDTAGPSLNPLIKVMNLVAILILPLIVGASKLPHNVKVIVSIVSILVLLTFLFISKRKVEY